MRAVYCLAGDTPILMADGTHRPLAELRVGDAIYGTVRDPPAEYRRYMTTVVLDRWASIKPAWRVALDDGRELIASADHRFLSAPRLEARLRDRARRAAAASAPDGRSNKWSPRASSSRALISRPTIAAATSAGWCAGTATCGRTSATGRTAGSGRINHFRLALADHEALSRSQDYLAGEGLELRRVPLRGGRLRPIERCTRSARAPGRVRSGDKPRRLAAVAERRVAQGFPGGHLRRRGILPSGGALRIANTDPAILAWTEDCLRHFGFRYDDRRDPKEPTDCETSASSAACPSVCASSISPIRRSSASARSRVWRSRTPNPPRVALDRASREGDEALRHHHRHRRLHRQRGGQPQLLRPPHPHLPRLQRGPRLRARDRRQGQRARGGCGPS